MQEAKELAEDESTDYAAAPLDDVSAPVTALHHSSLTQSLLLQDLFEWHATIRGAPGTDYEGGGCCRCDGERNIVRSRPPRADQRCSSQASTTSESCCLRPIRSQRQTSCSSTRTAASRPTRRSVALPRLRFAYGCRRANPLDRSPIDLHRRAHLISPRQLAACLGCPDGNRWPHVLLAQQGRGSSVGRRARVPGSGAQAARQNVGLLIAARGAPAALLTPFLGVLAPRTGAVTHAMRPATTYFPHRRCRQRQTQSHRRRLPHTPTQTIVRRLPGRTRRSSVRSGCRSSLPR